MKIRYTATYAPGIKRGGAPHVAADFVDSIEQAGAELLRNPYSAQETELRGIRRKYIDRFRYGLFYMVDEATDELIVMNIRHVARRWPWE
jgi:plasmid stabilization system protein ParE